MRTLLIVWVLLLFRAVKSPEILKCYFVKASSSFDHLDRVRAAQTLKNTDPVINVARDKISTTFVNSYLNICLFIVE